MLTIPDCVNSKEFLVIGLSGQIGAGKNYLSDECLSQWLLEKKHLSYVSLAHADGVKFDAIEEHNFDFESVFLTKPTRVRQALQEIGSRERKKDADIWIKRLHSQVLLHLFRGIKVIIITDNRFPNECDYLKQVFGNRAVLIRINAPKRVEQKLQNDYTQYKSDGKTIDEQLSKQKISEIANHPSETALNDYNGFDCVIDNDFENETKSFDDLKQFLCQHPFFSNRSDKNINCLD